MNKHNRRQDPPIGVLAVMMKVAGGEVSRAKLLWFASFAAIAAGTGILIAQ